MIARTDIDELTVLAQHLTDALGIADQREEFVLAAIICEAIETVGLRIAMLGPSAQG